MWVAGSGWTRPLPSTRGGRGREYNNAISGFIQDLQAQELKALGTIERTSTHRVSRLNYYLLGLLGVILILVTILVQRAGLTWPCAGRRKHN